MLKLDSFFRKKPICNLLAFHMFPSIIGQHVSVSLLLFDCCWIAAFWMRASDAARDVIVLWLSLNSELFMSIVESWSWTQTIPRYQLLPAMINHNFPIILDPFFLDCLSNNYIIMLNSFDSTLINHSISLRLYCSIHFVFVWLELNFLCETIPHALFFIFHYSIIFIMQVKYTARRRKAT